MTEEIAPTNSNISTMSMVSRLDGFEHRATHYFFCVR